MKYAPETQNFFQRVYAVVAQVPYGRVTTYGAVAKYLGAARSSRMVGWAMNGAGNHPEVPAHRVVNRVGLLTGKHHFPQTNLMQQLLENEDVVVKEDKVVDFKKHFWDPVLELGME